MNDRDAPEAARDGWRQRVVTKAVASNREAVGERALSRGEQLVMAARSLIAETGGTSFTVQEIAGRARTSLTTVYACFSGKDEILVAVLEEAIREAAEWLRERLDETTDPIDRLRVALVGPVLFAAGPARPADVMILYRERDRLGDLYPVEAQRAVEQLIDVQRTELLRARRAGVSSPIDPLRDPLAVYYLWTGMLGHLWQTAAFDELDAVADYIWQVCRRQFQVARTAEEPTA